MHSVYSIYPFSNKRHKSSRPTRVDHFAPIGQTNFKTNQLGNTSVSFDVQPTYSVTYSSFSTFTLSFSYTVSQSVKGPYSFHVYLNPVGDDTVYSAEDIVRLGTKLNPVNNEFYVPIGAYELLGPSLGLPARKEVINRKVNWALRAKGKYFGYVYQYANLPSATFILAPGITLYDSQVYPIMFCVISPSGNNDGRCITKMYINTFNGYNYDEARSFTYDIWMKDEYLSYIPDSNTPISSTFMGTTTNPNYTTNPVVGYDRAVRVVSTNGTGHEGYFEFANLSWYIAKHTTPTNIFYPIIDEVLNEGTALIADGKTIPYIFDPPLYQWTMTNPRQTIDLTIGNLSYDIQVDPFHDKDISKTPWYLVANFLQAQGTSNFFVRGTSLGFPHENKAYDTVNIEDGPDPANDEGGNTGVGESWGAVSNQMFDHLLKALGSPSGAQYGVELWFRAKSITGKIIDFKTDWGDLISHFRDGLGDSISNDSNAMFPGTNYTTFPGHNASIPANASSGLGETGDSAMCLPFWTLGNKWATKFAGTEWSVDGSGYEPQTFHQIWVRMDNSININWWEDYKQMEFTFSGDTLTETVSGALATIYNGSPTIANGNLHLTSNAQEIRFDIPTNLPDFFTNLTDPTVHTIVVKCQINSPNPLVELRFKSPTTTFNGMRVQIGGGSDKPTYAIFDAADKSLFISNHDNNPTFSNLGRASGGGYYWYFFTMYNNGGAWKTSTVYQDTWGTPPFTANKTYKTTGDPTTKSVKWNSVDTFSIVVGGNGSDVNIDYIGYFNKSFNETEMSDFANNIQI